MSSLRRRPLCLIQQDLGGQNRRGKGKVGKGIAAIGSCARCSTSPAGSSAVVRPAASGGLRDQVDGRGPPVALNLDGRRIAAEHNDDDLVAESRGRSGPAATVRAGSRPVAHRGGVGKRRRRSRGHSGPQTRSTAMAPRPCAVRRLTNAPPGGAAACSVRLVVADRRAHLRSRYRFQVSRRDGPFREPEDGEATVTARLYPRWRSGRDCVSEIAAIQDAHLSKTREGHHGNLERQHDRQRRVHDHENGRGDRDDRQHLHQRSAIKP